MPPLPLQSVYLTGNILSRFDNEMSCDLKLYTMNHWQTPEERERERRRQRGLGELWSLDGNAHHWVRDWESSFFVTGLASLSNVAHGDEYVMMVVPLTGDNYGKNEATFAESTQ